MENLEHIPLGYEYVLLRRKIDERRQQMFNNNRTRAEMDIELNLMKRRSIYIVFKMSELTGFKTVDLHQLNRDEAEEAVELVIQQIRSLMKKSRTPVYV